MVGLEDADVFFQAGLQDQAAVDRVQQGIVALLQACHLLVGKGYLQHGGLEQRTSLRAGTVISTGRSILVDGGHEGTVMAPHPAGIDGKQRLAVELLQDVDQMGPLAVLGGPVAFGYQRVIAQGGRLVVRNTCECVFIVDAVIGVGVALHERLERAGGYPCIDQRRQQRELLGTGVCGGVLLQHRREIWGACGSLPGIPDLSAAANEGQRGLFWCERHVIGEDRVEAVGDKVGFDDVGLVAVGPGDLRLAGDNVAAADVLEGAGLAGQVDVLDTELAEQKHFVGLLDAVLIGIGPDRELAEGGVAGVDVAVGVAVQRGERLEAVGGERSVGQCAGIAKELGAAGDRAIRSVDEEAAGGDPSDRFLLAGVGEIEQDLAVIDAGGSDALAQIDHERVAAAVELHAAEELVDQIVDGVQCGFDVGKSEQHLDAAHELLGTIDARYQLHPVSGEFADGGVGAVDAFVHVVHRADVQQGGHRPFALGVAQAFPIGFQCVVALGLLDDFEDGV
ncbi:hypothetical protein L665_00333 [Ralstonia solanacearum SD54]|nr:hypothetical protein L665_00333 [Ralstonia solanacearum SD54]